MIEHEDDDSQPRFDEWKSPVRDPRDATPEGWFIPDLSRRPGIIYEWQRIRAEGHRHAREFATKLLDQLSGYMGEAL